MGINTNVGVNTQPITGASKGITSNMGQTGANITTDTSGLQLSGSGGASAGVGAAGIAAGAASVLSSLPGIIANAKMDPSEIGQTREEVKEIVRAQNLTYVTQGMEVGGTIGSFFGPIGGLIGTAVGGLGGVIAGDTQKGRAINEFNRDQNEEVQGEWSEAETKRLQEYYDTTDSKRMQAELELIKQQNGFIS